MSNKRRKVSLQNETSCESYHQHIEQALAPFLLQDLLVIVLGYSMHRMESKLVAQFRSPHLVGPNGMAVEGEILYVASTGNSQVIAFHIPTQRVLLRIDCSNVYDCSNFYGKGVGPHELYIAGNLVVVGDVRPGNFHFFDKISGEHVRTICLEGEIAYDDYSMVVGEKIYIVSSLEMDSASFHVYDLYGKHIQRITVTGHQIQKEHRKRRSVFHQNEFYLFQEREVLTGRLPTSNEGHCQVERTLPWNKNFSSGTVDSDEIYYKVWMGEHRNKVVVASTATGLEIRTITLPGNRRFKGLSTVYPSEQGLFVSDWTDNVVYLFQ